MVVKSFAHIKHNCVCDYCHITFYKTPSRIAESINNFCTLECRGLFNRKRELVQCATCDKSFEKIQCYINRTSKSFCSAECYYKCPDKINHFTCHRSKAEDYLSSLILNDFPQINIIHNDTATLNNGLEIDLCIPELFIAIELNGPTHYTNIYGENNLLKTQDRDKRKICGLVELNYQLFIINISCFKNLKQAKPHIQHEYQNIIKPKILQIN